METSQIDTLVAEKVYHWHKRKSNGVLMWCNHEETPQRLAGLDFDTAEAVFSPSVSISDAWELLRLCHYATVTYMSGFSKEPYKCTLQIRGGESVEATEWAASAPLAICLAVLRSVGVDIDK